MYHFFFQLHYTSLHCYFYKNGPLLEGFRSCKCVFATLIFLGDSRDTGNKNGVFRLAISSFVPEIFKFLHYANKIALQSKLLYHRTVHDDDLSSEQEKKNFKSNTVSLGYVTLWDDSVAHIMFCHVTLCCGSLHYTTLYYFGTECLLYGTDSDHMYVIKNL